ncbi:hypothetical protein AVEN_1291-1 [Araneus ventricosus]|uniref:ribonuclease H n=1 Tax=Araneus ventricosus TaxID=182803 RepID=A0A4Y2HUX2_ARAVE|nr:hypothetical protein AVEN_1291-1 [Araneus ventricosus]
MSEKNLGDLWIQTDSSSSIQHLKNWTYIEDKTSLSILQKLKLISLQHDVHFQWIPSHVDIHGNELTYNLAKEDSSHPIPSSSEITFLRLFSGKKAQSKAEWLVPYSHYWYKGRKPGHFLSLPCDRQPSTCLSRLARGHLKFITYSESNKIYPLCPKCLHHQASPKNILNCLGLDWKEIYSSPLLVIDFIKVNGSLDMVHLQWIPSHVDIYGNEVADDLAKQGTAEPLCSTPSLTVDEIYSIRKNKDLGGSLHPMIGISGVVMVAPLALPATPTRRRCLDLLAVTRGVAPLATITKFFMSAQSVE